MEEQKEEVGHEYLGLGVNEYLVQSSRPHPSGSLEENPFCFFFRLVGFFLFSCNTMYRLIREENQLQSSFN